MMGIQIRMILTWRGTIHRLKTANTALVADQNAENLIEF
jgi:hypothetical protein